MKPNSRCRSCGAPVRWVITEANGKQMPLDPEGVPDGNVWVDHWKAGMPVVKMAMMGDAVPANVLTRYVSHFTTCPNADAWRAKKR